ncbi:radical SAM protein [Kosmotoga pacifica]|uniref:radical SAM protein n=1 Tax=Kosmotoga pacifica TaxID=1330330 RepID=UPI001C54D812
MNCKHCGAHYLRGMDMVERIPELIKNGRRSFLISGGLNKEYTIPWKEYVGQLSKMKKEHPIRYNFHVGPVVKEEDINTLKELADIVSFDVVGNEETMIEVYGEDLHRSSIKSLELLTKNGIKVVPHVTIGLKAGKLSHEFEALELLESHGLKTVVFLIFIPTAGTAYEKTTPPAITDVRKVFDRATNFRKILGCMHPGGAYRRNIQGMALSLGFEAIVQPIVPTIKKAEELNLKTAYFYECCGFLL